MTILTAELEPLISAATERLSDDEFRGALRRALSEAQRQSEPVLDGSIAEEVIPSEVMAHTVLLQAGAFAAAFAVELRRLLQTH